MKSEIKIQLERNYYLYNAINEFYSKWAKEHKLTYHSLFTLYAVYNCSQGCTQKRICEEWSIPKQTVNSILKNFEKGGYIAYIANDNDRRNKNVILTDKGISYAKEILSELYEVEKRAVRRLSIDKMKELNDISELFNDYLHEEIKEKNNG